MTVKGSATKAMFNAICSDTCKRAKKWFEEHPDVKVAYWAKDDFLPYESDSNAKAEFVKEHPEIEDINDHTLICVDGETVRLWHFCPRLRDGIKDFYESGICSGNGWYVKPDTTIENNWILESKGL